MEANQADFSGYATKAGLKCSDGRTIMSEAFKNCDGNTVPLVWQHGHNDPANILGHARLESRDDGVYAYAYFNETASAKNAKALVEHKDIVALSIYANQLIERSKQVFHGVIKEVSLVLSGANPGALIEYVSLAHSDGDIEVLEDEAVIFTGLTIEHADSSTKDIEDSEKTAEDIYESFTDEQKDVVHYMVGAALNSSESLDDDDLKHDDDEDNEAIKTVYDSFSDEQKEVVHYMIGAAINSSESLDADDASMQQADSGEDKTVEDVFNTLNDEQKNVVNYMIGAALEDKNDSAQHADTVDHTTTSGQTGEKTIQDVYDSLNEEQKNVVNYMIGAALESVQSPDTVKQSSEESPDDLQHANMFSAKKSMMDANQVVLDSTKAGTPEASKTILSSVKDMLSAGDVMMEASKDAGAKKSMSDAMTNMVAASKTGGVKEITSAGKSMIDAMDSMMGVKHSDNSDDNSDTNNEGDLKHTEGTEMTHNVFEQGNKTEQKGSTLTHDQLTAIVEDAKRTGSFKESFLSHAVEYGIENIDILFPDAVSVSSVPDVIGRRMEWVQAVLGNAKHSPFSRIKSTAVDLTADEARAKGYVKATLKKEEVIKLLKRVTTPTTIYKKQKLDRDDMVDITDLDVVAWLKAEMRVMLDEELAGAMLIGDGRDPEAEDKIDEACLRPIAFDDDMYAHQVEIPSNVTGDAIVEAFLRARTYYKGSNTPSLYTTDEILTDLILLKDAIGRRLYANEADLASALRVKEIIVVEVLTRVPDLIGIVVNIADYTLGADKGGVVSMFDDFDIDYNQYKYLIETRVSGALTKPKSAIVVKRVAGTVVVPVAPTYVAGTHTITIPTVAGVVYKVAGVTKAAGDLLITETTTVDAVPAATYAFAHNIDTDWTYTYTA